MEYRRLGRAGVRVSAISLGSWLTYGGAVEDRTAIACIHRAYDLGINFFDTANQYRRGGAEEVLGRALKDFPRDSYVLATKVFFPVGEGPNDRGLSRKHIMEQCHASLRRLGTDYIDLYQCHRYDPETPLEETLRALDESRAKRACCTPTARRGFPSRLCARPSPMGRISRSRSGAGGATRW